MQASWATVWSFAQPSGAAAPAGGGASEGTPVQGVPDKAEGKTAAPGACGAQDPVTFFITMIAMFAVFYLLLIRPQQKKAKEHEKMLTALQKGDDVVTAGGLIGKIAGISDKVLTLEVADKVRVRVVRSQVVDKFQAPVEK